MKTEIAVVIFFLKGCLKRDSQNTEKIDRFVERLAVALQEKFHGHWYPDDPSKGQAYRCIRINEFYQHDPELLRACQESGIGYQELKLPHELTLWVDPGEVCCRYDENRSWFSLATMCEDKDEKEIAQMVTKALDGKASDHQYQPRQSNPTIPKQQSCTQANDPAHWHSQTMARGRGHVFPNPHHMLRPHHMTQPHLWVQATQIYHCRYWGAQPYFHQY